MNVLKNRQGAMETSFNQVVQHMALIVLRGNLWLLSCFLTSNRLQTDIAVNTHHALPIRSYPLVRLSCVWVCKPCCLAEVGSVSFLSIDTGVHNTPDPSVARPDRSARLPYTLTSTRALIRTHVQGRYDKLR